MLNQATIFVLDSFSHDRLIYEQPSRLKFDRAHLHSEYTVVQLSPFSRAKREVPFSPESLYAPYPPDIFDRTLPGPFIELYLRDEARARAAAEACWASGVACLRLPAKEGYFFGALVAAATGESRYP